MIRVSSALLASLLLLLPACGREELISPEQPDLVLVTFSGLRADSLNSRARDDRAPLTPNLDGFIEDSSWAGRGVSSSSDATAALAALFTGARPWDLGFSCRPQPFPLRNEIPTLAEVLMGLGYTTVGLFSQPFHQPGSGFERGFDLYQKLRPSELSGILSGEAGPLFLWLGLPGPRSPSQTTNDPQANQTLYEKSVEDADRLFGKLLAGLRSGGASEDSVVLLTSDAGWPLGALAGHGLSRGEIEVPIAWLMPSPGPPQLSLHPQDAIATRRLFSTLIEIAGGTPPTGAPPSLYRGASTGVLSELYCREGRNTVSYLEDGLQLILERELLPLAGSLERRGHRRRGHGSEGFSRPPLTSEANPPLLRLERWARQGTIALDDEALVRRLVRQLDKKWQGWQEAEMSPERMTARKTSVTVVPDPQER